MGFGLKGLRGERDAGGDGNGQGGQRVFGGGTAHTHKERWLGGGGAPHPLCPRPKFLPLGGGNHSKGRDRSGGVEGRSGAATRTQSSPGWWEVSEPRRAPGSACCRSAGTSPGIRARVGRSGGRGRRQPAGGWMGWRPSSTGEAGAGGSDPPPLSCKRDLVNPTRLYGVLILGTGPLLRTLSLDRHSSTTHHEELRVRPRWMGSTGLAMGVFKVCFVVLSCS